LCPFDFGGPDFYELTIRYVPTELAIEARSLKEYLQAYRDRQISAERLAEEIHSDLQSAIKPDTLYVKLEQARRGGIAETVEKGDYELRR